MKRLCLIFLLVSLACAQGPKKTFIPFGGTNSQTSSYTATNLDVGKLIVMNCASCTLSLPSIIPFQQWTVFVNNLNASVLTVSPNALTLDGSGASLTLAQNQGMYITTDGSNYFSQRGGGGGSGGGLPGASSTGQIPVATGVGSIYAAQSKPILDVRDFAGANLGVQLQAVHDSASCPSSGCVIDARGIGPTGTITGLAITKPISVLWSASTITVSGSMVFTNINGLRWEGAGQGLTFFNWAGNNSTPMFRLISVQQSDFGDMSLTATTTFPLTAFFTSERGAAGNPTNNQFHDMIMQGTNGGVTDAFKWITGAGGDAGNDTFEFMRVIAANYTHAGWNSSGQTQSQGHTFFNCQATSNGFGQYGYYGNGSFAMYNMQLSANSVSDITITSPNSGVLISGGLSIGSNRFYTDPAGISDMPVTIEQMNIANTGLNADGNLMIFTSRGPYLLLGNMVYGNSVATQFYLSAANGHQSGTAIGNNILTSLTTPFNAPAGTSWTLLNNTINNGPPTNLADTWSNPIGMSADNTYDIGASGATRPRTGYFGTSVVTPTLTLGAAPTATLATGAVTNGTCATAVTVAWTDATTASVVSWSFASDTNATGYGFGGLLVSAYPTSGNANFRVCNPTAAPITPSAMTLNFRVIN